MFSNRYIFVYSAIMVIVVAAALTVVAVQLKPVQENNIRIEKMQNILASANIESDKKSIEIIYKKYITKTFVVNPAGEKLAGVNAFDVDMALENKKDASKRNLPVFVCTLMNGDNYYIVPLRGRGLWGPIWGYISFQKDYNTVYGAIFDHKGETPGLGAEINTKEFQKQFREKRIFDDKRNFVSIRAVKGGAKTDDIHGVDAISGGTITSNGLTSMLKDCLIEYENYFKEQNIGKYDTATLMADTLTIKTDTTTLK
jgi:Na+-transporting NADH:ubiquinone oxidoreductase subunit C